jgi:hypothetical protein
MNVGAVLTGVVIVGLIGAIGYLIARIVKGEDKGTSLPELPLVGVRASGVLTCPTCASASFQAVRAGSGDFYALALGPLVFGSMNASKHIVECVVCGSRYRRGVPRARTDFAASA